jgi:hypothetical protein
VDPNVRKIGQSGVGQNVRDDGVGLVSKENYHAVVKLRDGAGEERLEQRRSMPQVDETRVVFNHESYHGRHGVGALEEQRRPRVVVRNVTILEHQVIVSREGAWVGPRRTEESGKSFVGHDRNVVGIWMTGV